MSRPGHTRCTRRGHVKPPAGVRALTGEDTATPGAPGPALARGVGAIAEPEVARRYKVAIRIAAGAELLYFLRSSSEKVICAVSADVHVRMQRCGWENCGPTAAASWAQRKGLGGRKLTDFLFTCTQMRLKLDVYGVIG